MTHRARPLSFLKHRAARRGDESGAAIVEFSLVVGLFVFMLYGIIAFGMAIGVKQNVTHAAFAGARAAVGLTGTAARDTAVNKTNEALDQYPAGSYTVTVPIPGPCSVGSGNCITVTVDFDYENHPVVPNAPGLGVVLPPRFHAESTVQIS